MNPRLAMPVLILITLALPATCLAQNLLSNPESIVYDAEHRCYLVSNWADDGPGTKGTIVRIDGAGNQSYFNTDLIGQYGIAGLYIHGDQLLAAAGNAPDPGIAVYSLETSELVDFISVVSNVFSIARTPLLVQMLA